MSLIANTKKQQAAGEYLQSIDPVFRALVQLYSALTRSGDLRRQLLDQLSEAEAAEFMAELYPLVRAKWNEKDSGLKKSGLELLSEGFGEAAETLARDPQTPAAGTLTKNELIDLLKDAE